MVVIGKTVIYFALLQDNTVLPKVLKSRFYIHAVLLLYFMNITLIQINPWQSFQSYQDETQSENKLIVRLPLPTAQLSQRYRPKSCFWDYVILLNCKIMSDMQWLTWLNPLDSERTTGPQLLHATGLDLGRAVLFRSAHEVSAALASSSSDFLRVFFALFPCGFHSNACLVTLLGGFLSVWPIQPHFLFEISPWTGRGLMCPLPQVSVGDNFRPVDMPDVAETFVDEGLDILGQGLGDSPCFRDIQEDRFHVGVEQFDFVLLREGWWVPYGPKIADGKTWHCWIGHWHLGLFLHLLWWYFRGRQTCRLLLWAFHSAPPVLAVCCSPPAS